MPVSVEDRQTIAKAETICQLIIVAKAIGLYSKGELSLSDCGLFVSFCGIKDVVVVDDSILVLECSVMVGLVWEGNHHINIWLRFSQVRNLQADIGYSML